MKKEPYISLPGLCLWLVLSFLNFSCTSNSIPGEENKVNISSPDGALTAGFQLKDGIPFYHLKKGDLALLNDSRLGFKFKEIPAFDNNFTLRGIEKSTIDSSWVHDLATGDTIRVHYNKLLIRLAGESGDRRKMNLVFKVYNDGISFRYEIPEQGIVKELQVIDELTEFSVANNFDVWWIPAYSRQEQYEPAPRKNKVSELSEAVKLPLTMAYGNRLFLSIHEAALPDYALMTLVNNGNNTLKCDLSSQPNSLRVKAASGKTVKTPWRTIQVTEKPEALLSSFLLLHLPEQDKLRELIHLAHLNKASVPSKTD